MRTLLPVILAAGLSSSSSAQLVINEVDYDQPSTDNREYLELKNTGEAAFDMTNLRVVMVNGENGNPVIYQTYASDAWAALAPGGYFVLCGNDGATANCDAALSPASNAIQNESTDAIVLLDMTDSTVMDMVSYEGSLLGFTEGTGTAVGDDNTSTDRSIGRFPDGADTDNNAADFIRMCTTPGLENSSDTTDCEVPTALQFEAAAPALSVFHDPANELVWMNCTGLTAGTIRFEVFTLEGSLIAQRTTSNKSWAWPTDGRHGTMVLVRAATNAGSMTRRIVLP